MIHSTEDLSYAAASIDCEGCIHIASYKGTRSINTNYNPRVQIKITDRVLTDWFKQTFGGATHSQRAKRVGWKPSYIWCITCKQAYVFLREVLPFLKLKRGQAEVAMELQERIYQTSGKRLPDSELKARMALKESMHILNKRGV